MKKGNKKSHLSREERIKLEGLLATTLSYQDIATVLNRGKSTLCEEVKRNGGRKRYDGKRAHRRAYFRQYRKKRDCNMVAISRFLTRFIEKSLTFGWSPERIASRLRFLKKINHAVEYASGKSIRGYIKKRPGLERFLYSNRVKKKSGPKRGTWIKDTTRKFVDSMPTIKGFGAFEVDFMVSSKSTAVLLVLVDVVTKLTLMRILPNRINTEVNITIVEMLTPYPVDTLIPDNDIAFVQWRELEKRTGATVYFARTYTSTDKPLVENTNKWIREFLPKKTDFASVDDSFIHDIQEWFNHTPRECLGGMTPWEMYQKEMGNDIVIEKYPRHPLLSSLSVRSFVFGG